MSVGAIFCLIFGGLAAVMVAYLVGGMTEAASWRRAGERWPMSMMHSGLRDWTVMPVEQFDRDYVYKGYVVGGMWSPTGEDLERWGRKKGAA